MNSERQEHENTFSLRVQRSEAGFYDISFDLPDNDEESSSVSLASDPNTPGLYDLSQSWTSIAIGFFETVPKLAFTGHYIASMDLKESVVAQASESAIKVIESDDENGVTEYILNLRDLPLINQKIGKSQHATKGAIAMGRATLGALLSEYEAFLYQLLKILANIRPEKFLSGSEKNYSLDDLSRFSSIEEFREEALEKRLIDILQGNTHTATLDWLGKNFDVNLLSDERIIKEFVEICQRRHLLTHSGGVVNRRYRNVCSKFGWTNEELPALGTEIKVGRQYLRRATARIYQVGFYSLHMIWQKHLPDTCDKSLGCILAASHDFLEADLTKMARRIADFGLNTRGPRSHKRTLYLSINKAQGILYDEGIPEEEKQGKIEDILSRCDLSLKTPLVELVLACLRRDFKDLDMLTGAAKSAGLSYSYAYTWSIFREARDLKEFNKHFS
ncbi:hypothetical protein [Roseovarius sp. TE539]|uniref:hypothetical protein n=1 Tax=Roseovarius sp. TE539 TaxID=2249812 RepID=UPI0011BF7884|nr:hypothetical protein [Roseovarius sp. TE539]